MNTPPILTDLHQLSRNRARAHRDALFFHDAAAAEIKDRLEEVNRRFTKTAIVTGFPDLWAEFFPDAVFVPDDDALKLTPGEFDLVINALTMHWANDPVGQLVQCQRALRPDGFFLGVTFGGRTLAGLRAALAEAETSITGGLSPRVLPMADIRDLGGLMQRAGFAQPVADGVVHKVTYANPYALMRDLRAMGEGNALHLRNRKPTVRGLLDLAGEYYRQSHGQPDGRVNAEFEFVFLSGWSPHESQQRPLRPGSAQARLADALGAIDTDKVD